MRDPSLRISRLSIAGGILAVALVGGGGFYFGRSTSPKPAAEPTAIAATPAPAQPAIREIERTLDRADLLQLAAMASDAVATASRLPAEVRGAVGGRFELALPFGCSGPASADSAAPLRWRYDADDATLRLHVAMTAWPASDWGLGDDEAIEAIEGFWVTRPWTSSAQCPSPPTGKGRSATNSPEPVEQTLAVAQFFGDEARREALRDGRPFESTQRVAPDAFAAPRGLRLLLSGRIDRVPSADGQGSPVRCVQPGGPEQRPRCIVAVSLDQVRIENPTSGEVLATWQIGSR